MLLFNKHLIKTHLAINKPVSCHPPNLHLNNFSKGKFYTKNGDLKKLTFSQMIQRLECNTLLIHHHLHYKILPPKELSSQGIHLRKAY